MAIAANSRYFILGALLFLTIQVHGQFEKDYGPLQYAGEIPAAFLEKSSDRILLGVAERQDLELSRKQSKEFLSNTDFALQRLLTGGNVLFNDSVSVYLQKVVDKLLASEPELKKKVNVYLLRIPAVNAFSWQDGTLFITLGMLQRIETEGQLAFIMGHEIAHYELKHSLLKYKHNKQVFKSNIFGRADETESLLLSRSYSREKEEEADNRGLALALSAGYHYSEAIKTLQMLDSSEHPLPYDSFNVDTFFTTLKSRFAEAGFKEEVSDKKKGAKKVVFKSNPTNVRVYNRDNENKNDTLSEADFSTHPAIPARIAFIESTMKANANNQMDKGRRLAHIQDIASFEIIEFFWRQKNLVNTIKYSMILQQKYPENSYLHAMITKSLWWAGYYKQNDALEEVCSAQNINDKAEGRALLKNIQNATAADLYRYAYLYGNDAINAGEINDETVLYTARAAEQADMQKEARQLYRQYGQSYPTGKHINFVKAKLD